MNHRKPKVEKWLRLWDLFSPQKLLLALGCALLAIGIGAFVLLSPSAPEDESVQKQQAPTLQQAQQQVIPQTKDPEASSDINSALLPQKEETALPSEQPPNSAKPSGATGKPATQQMQWPLDGEILTAFSGDTLVYYKALNAWRTHNGIDIAGQADAAVCAALPGEVTDAVTDKTLGGVVTISHSDGRTTLYAGLTEVCVDPGDKVNAGQTIGMLATPPFEQDLGPHLHFEYTVNGILTDPVPLLPERS